MSQRDSIGSTNNRHAIRDGPVPSKAVPPSHVRSAHVALPADGSRSLHPCIRPELPLSPFSRDTRETSNPILTSDSTAAAVEYRLLGATQDPRSAGGVGGTIRYSNVAQLEMPLVPFDVSPSSNHGGRSRSRTTYDLIRLFRNGWPRVKLSTVSRTRVALPRHEFPFVSSQSPFADPRSRGNGTP